MNRVLQPLKADHPLVTEKTRCPLCLKVFQQTERPMLLSASANIASTLQAVCVHASCGLRGLKTEHGEIERIKDGDGSPYPVLTTDGKQHTLEELGIA